MLDLPLALIELQESRRLLPHSSNQAFHPLWPPPLLQAIMRPHCFQHTPNSQKSKSPHHSPLVSLFMLVCHHQPPNLHRIFSIASSFAKIPSRSETTKNLPLDHNSLFPTALPPLFASSPMTVFLILHEFLYCCDFFVGFMVFFVLSVVLHRIQPHGPINYISIEESH